MKTKLIAVAVAAVMMTACASNPAPKVDPVQAMRTAEAKAVLDTAPSWYMNGTPATADHMFTAGTAVSRDLSMAVKKATMDAQAKIAEYIRADVDAYTKVHKQDVNGAYNENTEVLVRKLVNEIQLSRGTVVQKVAYSEAGSFRVYVQIRYPAPNIERAVAATNTYDGPTARERKLEAELNQRKEEARKAKEVAPVDVGGIVIKGIEASPESKPLNLDSKEEN